MHYILVNNIPVKTDDLQLWSIEFSKSRIIRNDALDGDVTISTVFLGIDHRHHGGVGLPVLFETMVFGGEYDQLQQRYCSIEESIEGHEKILYLIDRGRTRRHNKLKDLGI